MRTTGNGRRDRHCWVPSHTDLQVGGITVKGGLFYAGEGLQALSSYRDEPALIDPTLPVSASNPDWATAQLDYWPSYRSLGPAARAAYLYWLSSYRNAPNTPIGYVFLYLYGLERRALHDAQRLPEAAEDLPAIRAEVARLRASYGSNSSFSGYASSLISALDCMSGSFDPAVVPAPGDAKRWQIPPSLEVALGRLVAEGRPVSAEWALRLACCHPRINFRTPAQRCPDLFCSLFAMRFKERYGDGLTLEASRTRVAVTYLPASRSFGGEVSIPIASLPDVAGDAALRGTLQTLVDSCTDELERYSRFVGQHPGDRRSLAAVALLPAALVAACPDPAITELARWVDEQLGEDDEHVVDGAELVARWPASREGTLTKDDASALASLLEALGYGIEPDVRLGVPQIGAPQIGPGPAVIFRLTGSGALAGARLDLHAGVVELVATIAAASAADDLLLHSISEELQRQLGIPTEGYARIHARLRRAVVVGVRPRISRRRLASSAPASRRAIGELLVAIASARGGVGPEQVGLLVEAFAALDLEVSSLYSGIHGRASTAPNAPSVLRTPTPARSRQAGSFPPDSSDPGPLALDEAAVRAKLAESATVSALLGQIFAADDEPTSATSTTQPPGPLDAAHLALLEHMGSRPSWPRAEFIQLASLLGLLPDAALDTLNEAAFELLGEPVTEGDDPIDVDFVALAQLGVTVPAELGP